MEALAGRAAQEYVRRRARQRSLRVRPSSAGVCGLPSGSAGRNLSLTSCCRPAMELLFVLFSSLEDLSMSYPTCRSMDIRFYGKPFEEILFQHYVAVGIDFPPLRRWISPRTHALEGVLFEKGKQ